MCIKGFSYIGRLLKVILGYDHLLVWGNKLPDPTVFYERILEKFETNYRFSIGKKSKNLIFVSYEKILAEGKKKYPATS